MNATIGSLRRRSRIAAAAIGCALALSGALAIAPTRAQDAYPSRLVTILVPYPAGGVVDLIGRLLADGLKDQFGQQVIVLNKPGANGMIGLTELVRAPADGYTLLINNDGGLAIPPAVDANFRWDPEKDYTPIAQAGEFTWLFIVSSSLPVKSLPEFVAYARANPDRLNYGTPGVGTLPHMASELFAKQTGLKMTHVPYKGGSPVVADLLGGVLSMAILPVPTVITQVANERLRVLATLGSRRMKDLPDVPTMAELGYKDFTVASWNGLFGPPNLPAPVRDKLARGVLEFMRRPAVEEKFRAIAFDAVGLDADAFARRYVSEVAKWRAFARETGIRVTQ